MENYYYFTCTNPLCGLRFPAFREVNHPANCPRCNAQLITHQYPAVPSPTNDLKLKAGVELSVLLDNIRSAFNVGSMLRTSDGAGVKHIYLCGVTSTPYNPKVSKTSLGAETTIPWSYHPNGIEICRKHKEEGMRLWALEYTSNSESLFDIGRKIDGSPILLVIGNEVTGIDPEILPICDQVIHIPMVGIKRSLNVAIAFGVAVYTICQVSTGIT